MDAAQVLDEPEIKAIPIDIAQSTAPRKRAFGMDLPRMPETMTLHSAQIDIAFPFPWPLFQNSGSRVREEVMNARLFMQPIRSWKTGLSTDANLASSRLPLSEQQSAPFF